MLAAEMRASEVERQVQAAKERTPLNVLEVSFDKSRVSFVTQVCVHQVHQFGKAIETWPNARLRRHAFVAKVEDVQRIRKMLKRFGICSKDSE